MDDALQVQKCMRMIHFVLLIKKKKKKENKKEKMKHGNCVNRNKSETLQRAKKPIKELSENVT